MDAADTRLRIAEAADRLFYERGFEATSFADIAKAVGLSRGNFYYHFESKDQILQAVLSRRLEATSALLQSWNDQTDDPAERIVAFTKILITNQSQIMAFGCPVGSLANELAKLAHSLRDEAAGLFGVFADWLTEQFAALDRPYDARKLALHVLMRSQGVATLATAFKDEAFLRREVDDIEDWIKALPHQAKKPPPHHLSLSEALCSS